MRDLPKLEKDSNEKLKERLEAVSQALDDEYELHFELLTTGHLTDAANSDLQAFADELANSDFPASVEVVDTDVIQARLTEADGRELPSLNHEIAIDPGKAMFAEMQGTRSVVAAISLRECLKIPGILDGRLFRKNVRQFLGANNKINRGLRQTLAGDRVRDFFFYHNGITALCRKFEMYDDDKRLKLEDLSVVNGCQSLMTIYSSSQRIKSLSQGEGYVLFRFYEIPQRDLADRISVYTNSQSTVKPRDLRSNDRVMLSMKRSYEMMYPSGLFITQRGTDRPADKDVNQTIDCSELAKAMMAWQFQRPNAAHNERRLFDENYRVLFRADYPPESMLGLKSWLTIIDKAWTNLALIDALKAGKSYVRLHLLYPISTLIAHASGQGDKVPKPGSTLEIANKSGNEILPLAVNCLNKALESAVLEAQVGGKVFSPQNWAKSRASVQSETLVASTMIGVLPGMGAQVLMDKLKVAPQNFELRWSAE